MTAGDQQGRQPPREPEPTASPSRRGFLRQLGIGGAAVVGGAGLASQLGSDQALASHHAPGERASIGGGGGPSAPIAAARDGAVGSHGQYGSMVEPPAGLRATALDALTRPPAAGSSGVDRHELDITQRVLALADGVSFDGWVFGASAPGPIIRATEGELVRIRVRNRTAHPHNLHLHGRHSPQMDGWEPIPPGEEFTYEVTAAPFGLHPYHCHVAPLAEHIGRGLYGAVIVDPPGGRAPAHEVVLMLSGWDLDGDGRNELYTWNGVAGFYHRFPITVPVGELVRVYVLNMTEYDPLGSFHLHAETFAVYWHGTATEPDLIADTVTLAQGDRAIVEFTLPERGRYMFHPHQHHMADRGAMGWFAAV